MRIDVKELLRSEIGTSKTFAITNERPELADVLFASPVSGEVSLVRLEDAINASGTAQATLQFECHRCLRAFEREGRIHFSGDFVDHPDGDQWPITRRDFSIDLGPLLRQEFLLDQPIQLLCEEDCPGLCEVCGARNEPGHSHQAVRQ